MEALMPAYRLDPDRREFLALTLAGAALGSFGSGPVNRFSGWLDYPEYYFFWNFHGNNSIFNISAYKNPAMDQLIDRARFTQDQAEYERSVKDFIALCMAEVPIVPLNQPSHDVAMQKAIGGYEFWFHREPDFRQFSKG
jgi:peptide/nickel transport system substrate-binding protein